MITKKYFKLVKVSYEDSGYFYIKNVSDQTGTLTVVNSSSYRGTPPQSWRDVEYSLDGVNWYNYDLSTKPDISVPSGLNLYIRGNGGGTYGYSNVNNYGGYTLRFDVDFNIGGNLLSIIDKTNYATMTSLSGSNNFKELFNLNTHLKDASNLNFGHLDTLTDSCFSSMFSSCNSLTAAPALPATTLANSCYGGMFSRCTSLTAAPELPATTLANSCYNSMFSSCTSLTTVQATLPAETLAGSCYQNMFNNCTSLTTAPALPATTLANSCYNSMFISCTSLTTAPELPATTLANDCYNQMFRNCTSLSNITCMATNISASNCTVNWLSGVSATGTFTKSTNMSGWTTGNSGIPSGWTVVDA